MPGVRGQLPVHRWAERRHRPVHVPDARPFVRAHLGRLVQAAWDPGVHLYAAEQFDALRLELLVAHEASVAEAGEAFDLCDRIERLALSSPHA